MSKKSQLEIFREEVGGQEATLEHMMKWFEQRDAHARAMKADENAHALAMAKLQADEVAKASAKSQPMQQPSESGSTIARQVSKSAESKAAEVAKNFKKAGGGGVSRDKESSSSSSSSSSSAEKMSVKAVKAEGKSSLKDKEEEMDDNESILSVQIIDEAMKIGFILKLEVLFTKKNNTFVIHNSCFCYKQIYRRPLTIISLLSDKKMAESGTTMWGESWRLDTATTRRY